MGGRLGLAGIVVLFAAACCALLAPAAPAQGPAAHVWVTTPEGTQRLSDRGSVEFRAGGSPNLTISVDPSRSYQTMDGFGASITDSPRTCCRGWTAGPGATTMKRLFSPSEGAGLSFLRQPMGASDFVAGGFYTYDDLPAGRTDYDMRQVLDRRTTRGDHPAPAPGAVRSTRG